MREGRDEEVPALEAQSLLKKAQKIAQQPELLLFSFGIRAGSWVEENDFLCVELIAIGSSYG